MAKWPNVPHCYGWLGLDARGHWFMLDDRTQALGSFASGAPVTTLGNGFSRMARSAYMLNWKPHHLSGEWVLTFR